MGESQPIEQSHRTTFAFLGQSALSMDMALRQPRVPLWIGLRSYRELNPSRTPRAGAARKIHLVAEMQNCLSSTSNAMLTRGVSVEEDRHNNLDCPIGRRVLAAVAIDAANHAEN